MSEQEVKLSLGCGRKKIEGFIGLDIMDFGWNKVWDVTRDQIPMADSSVDFIEMYNFLEHIERKYWIKLFNECWRVLKPAGVLNVMGPDVSKDLHLALSDPTHLSIIVPGLLKYLKGERPRNADYGLKHWMVQENRHYDEKEPRCFYWKLRPNK